MGFSQLSDALYLNPGTLKGTINNEFIASLYQEFGEDLKAFCSTMAGTRRNILEKGLSADFSDYESALLYMLIRKLKPATVVEISPCYGYSTNYILGALTANGTGALHSYEIAETANGQPIESVIRGNLADGLAQDRMTLHVGDASKAEIPDPDFLFIDSCHETWFSAWYMSQLVPRAGVCFVHDIIIHDEKWGARVPKAPFLGIREPVHVLEALAENGQQILAAADVKTANVISGVPERAPGLSERSIFFSGHKQSKQAEHIHSVQKRVYELSQRALFGDDRIPILKEAGSIMCNSPSSFSRICAASLIPLLGYDEKHFQMEFAPHYAGFRDALSSSMTLPQYLAALEVGKKLASAGLLKRVWKQAKHSDIEPGTRMALWEGYQRLSVEYPGILLRAESKVRRLLTGAG